MDQCNDPKRKPKQKTVHNEKSKGHSTKADKSCQSLTSSEMDGSLFRPGEMTDISGRRGLESPPCSAAVDSNTGISSSSSMGYPHGEDNDSAMSTYKNRHFKLL